MYLIDIFCGFEWMAIKMDVIEKDVWLTFHLVDQNRFYRSAIRSSASIIRWAKQTDRDRDRRTVTDRAMAIECSHVIFSKDYLIWFDFRFDQAYFEVIPDVFLIGLILVFDLGINRAKKMCEKSKKKSRFSSKFWCLVIQIQIFQFSGWKTVNISSFLVQNSSVIRTIIIAVVVQLIN